MSRPCVATAEKNMIAFDKRKKVKSNYIPLCLGM